MKKEIKIYECFAGIGATQYALEKVLENNTEFYLTNVGMCERNAFAIIIHHFMNNKNPIITPSEKGIKPHLDKEITTVDKNHPLKMQSFEKALRNRLSPVADYLIHWLDNPNNTLDIKDLEFFPDNLDLLTCSWPCQDVSRQGNETGLHYNKRSSLIWDFILKLGETHHKPKFILLENVPGLLQPRYAHDMSRILTEIQQMGYKEPQFGVLDSSDFGSAQKRKRIFILFTRNDLKGQWYLPLRNYFPKQIIKDKNRLCDVLKNTFTDSQNITSDFEGMEPIIWHNKKGLNYPQYCKFTSNTRISYKESVGPTLTACEMIGWVKIMDKQTGQIFRMHHLDAFMYMGFAEGDVHRVDIFNADSIKPYLMYKLAANSIEINTLKAIFEKLVECLQWQE